MVMVSMDCKNRKINREEQSAGLREDQQKFEKEKTPRYSRIMARRICGRNFSLGQTLNELPQPQVDFTFGLLNLKPAASSVST